MGLVITDKNVVLVDGDVKDYLVTTEEGNPKCYEVNINCSSINVFSIFTRLKASSKERRNREGRKIGDNCPMIYALKGKEELSTTYRSVRSLLISGEKIVRNNFIINSNSILVPIPSSHTVVKHLSTLLSRHLGISIMEGVLEKVTVYSAIQDLEKKSLQVNDYKKRKEIDNIIKKLRQQDVFALKYVPTEFRHFIHPVVQGSVKLGSQHQSIILVDDLVSTGTSLLGAMNVLKASNPNAKYQAISLFSKV